MVTASCVLFVFLINPICARSGRLGPVRKNPDCLAVDFDKPTVPTDDEVQAADCCVQHSTMLLVYYMLNVWNTDKLEVLIWNELRQTHSLLAQGKPVLR